MPTTVIDWLDKTVASTPDAAAFIDDNESLTFAKLDAEACAIAAALLPVISPRKPVIVMTGRHVHTPACFLGVAMAGCFYAPMDATVPRKRLEQMLAVIEADVLVADAASLPTVQELGYSGTIISMEEALATPLTVVAEQALAERRAAFTSDMPLYTIFTSGSTGAPKGVTSSHGALINYIDGISDVLSICSADCIGSQSPLDYIAAIRDVYFPVKTGATTVIIPKSHFVMPTQIFDVLNKHAVNTICWTTAALTLSVKMKAFEWSLPTTLEKICFSGSVMPGSTLRVWQNHLPKALFVNQYGPTEATASCTYFVVNEHATDETVLPLGKPFPNYGIALLDENLAPVPEGEIGEICVYGPVLALGYYNAPDITAKAFVPSPFDPTGEERMYRTGDLGSWRKDGELMFHGRKDRQIKHMGHRVELDEVEGAAQAVAGVAEAFVFYRQKQEQIVLLFIGDADKKAVAATLRTMLPDFMVPRKITKMDEFPRLPNGKKDVVTMKAMVERKEI